ncbi:LysR family transcriptional regulator [Amycolatopsis pittospori]|uniref:LysR family transcriptional regulator n=1 Tax=Amycolatopsis pittospori TaxID=2749434 RepID=UPI0015F0B674|nr:LysR family transcriptional regulator [Amycolatopsis pittospori]
MELEFRHLRVVLAILETGGVTAAANRLGVSQPAVTHALHRAERIAGGALFQRGATGSTPTRLGELVAEHARIVLAAVDRLGAAVVRDATGRTRFGCTPGMLVASLGVLAPAIFGSEVEVRTTPDAGPQLALLADRHIEAALLAEHPAPAVERPPGVASRTVAVEPMFVALSVSHPLATRPEIDIADLAGETWCVSESRDDGLVEHLSDIVDARHVRTADYTTALQLAELNRAVLPIMPGSRPREGLAQVPLAGIPLRMTTTLLWHPEGALREPDVERLHAALAEAQHDVVERTPVYRTWLAAHPDWTTTPG